MHLQANGCTHCHPAFASGYVRHNIGDCTTTYIPSFPYTYFKVLKKPSSAMQLRTDLASLKEELQRINITVRKTAPKLITNCKSTKFGTRSWPFIDRHWLKKGMVKQSKDGLVTYLEPSTSSLITCCVKLPSTVIGKKLFWWARLHSSLLLVSSPDEGLGTRLPYFKLSIQIAP